MIDLINITKTYETRHGKIKVLDKVNLNIPKGGKVGILGRNGAGKSTLIRILSGAELPDAGSINRGMHISWPLAFGGAFQGSLTGLDNLRFICRVYGTSAEDKIPYVQEFSELGAFLREPVRTYSSGMRARLAFAVSMAIEFDCYLIDEVVAVGDSRFHEKCKIELFEKRSDRAIIMVSHDFGYIQEHCDSASVLISGRLHGFATPKDAQDFYLNGVPN